MHQNINNSQFSTFKLQSQVLKDLSMIASCSLSVQRKAVLIILTFQFLEAIYQAQSFCLHFSFGRTGSYPPAKKKTEEQTGKTNKK